MNFTEHQANAIAADGNMIVVAGAGTGKTRTLVERCVERLIEFSGDDLAPDQRLTIDNVLIVTFTDAAASEVRHRVRARIEEAIKETGNAHLRDQLELLETAHISTLHSFCFRLIRQHFYELGLDPGMSVLTKKQADILRLETLDRLFLGLYSSENDESKEVRALLLEHFQGRDERVREVALELHHYTQTRPNPEAWYEAELQKLSNPDPTVWSAMFNEELVAWMRDWAAYLRTLDPENSNAHACAEILEKYAQTDPCAAVELISKRDLLDCWPKKKKIAHRAEFSKLFDEANFLNSLVPRDGKEPLAEDWAWFAKPARIIISLARDFERAYAAAKHERGGIDFHDLEQFALQLLWDDEKQAPSELAKQWQERFHFVFVDEYQDINAAQDKIIFCLSREGPNGNRFLVGDVKQSIYRFRQADPMIFRKYMSEVKAGAWKQFFLSHNFRSEERILQFVNRLFGSIMRAEFGGIAYDQNAALQYGKKEKEKAERNDSDGSKGPEVEVHLLVDGSDQTAPQSNGEHENGEDAEPEEDLEKAELEALHVGRRLLQLKKQRDLLKEKSGDLRNASDSLSHPMGEGRGETPPNPSSRMDPMNPPEPPAPSPVGRERAGVRVSALVQGEGSWKDMVILLRSLKGKVESYARVFEHLGIPLQLKRNAFYNSIEVLDLLNLLTILDNPLQDIPLLAVLRSPFAGFEAAELVRVRLALRSRNRTFWEALHEYERKNTETTLGKKCAEIIAAINRWRELGNHCSISARLETILQETLYADWIVTQPRGKQRQANVFQFVRLAREFDHLNGEGLYLFLRQIQLEQDASEDADPAPGEATDSVRLISVHQSKGLEFPIVVIPDLSKRFNFQDLTSGLILDEQYGLCTHIKAETTGALYPSLPYWLAAKRERKEIQAEEMRVLYVAMTRAQSKLILVGSATPKQLEKWEEKATCTPSAHQLLAGNSWLDWIGPCLTAQNPEWIAGESRNEHWASKIIESSTLKKGGREETAAKPLKLSPEEKAALMQKFSFIYPYAAATLQQAKSTVTRLRRGLAEGEESKLSSVARADWPRRAAAGNKSGTALGKAYHTVLEHAPFEVMTDEKKLRKFVKQLEVMGILSEEQAEHVEPARLSAFWQSEIGREISQNAAFVQRELPFTAKFTGANLQQFEAASAALAGLPEDEFIIVQGAIDLAVILPGEIWLLDFKSDYVPEGGEMIKVEQYTSQLNLYAMAMEKVYKRRVTRKWLHLLTPGKTFEVADVAVEMER